MVTFKDYSLHGQKTISIANEDGDPAKILNLPVFDPIIGHFSHSWSPSVDSPHLTRWCIALRSDLFDHSDSTTISLEALFLQSSLHSKDYDADRFILLGDRIDNREASWDTFFSNFGEFSYIPKYWEWLEDVLSRHKRILMKASIYDAVYASLFTYDRSENLIRSLCESWCPSTNTFHTPTGELSISLWDLRNIGGLSIHGIFYDEVVPSGKEVLGFDNNKTLFLPPSCKYLFSAYHKLYHESMNGEVKIHDWVNFWFRGPERYAAPPRRINKKRFNKPRTRYNPTGIINEPVQRSKEEEGAFDDLAIKASVREETYLAALLTCWLCRFVFPAVTIDNIRPGVFKVASMMARGEKFSLAVPVLASVYRGLGEISLSPSPSRCTAIFPIHYVYGWLGHYFDCYFASSRPQSGARMVRFSGEKMAKHFDDTEARILLRDACFSNSPSLFLGKEKDMSLVDTGNQPSPWNDYIISIRCSYLTLRRGNELIVESYSPIRFARQFNFCQSIPGKLKSDLGSGTVAEIAQLWQSCTQLGTNAKFTIPAYSSKSLATKHYIGWWAKRLSNYCKKSSSLVIKLPKVNPSIIILKKNKREVAECTPVSREKRIAAKDVLGEPVKRDGNVLNRGSLIKRKQNCLPPNDEQSSSGGDRHWKRPRKKATAFELDDVHLDLDDIFPNTSNPSLPLEEFGNQLENNNELAEVDDMILQENEKSVNGLDSFDILFPQLEVSKVADNMTSHPVVEADSIEVIRQPCMRPVDPALSTISMFKVDDLISDCQRTYLTLLWNGLSQKIGRSNLNHLHTIEDEVEKVLKEMERVSVLDLSPLRNLLMGLFRDLQLYNSSRSSSAEKMSQKLHNEQLTKTKNELSDVEAREDVQTKDLQSLETTVMAFRLEKEQLEEKLSTLSTQIEESELQIFEKKSELSKLQAIASSLKEEISVIESKPVLSDEDVRCLANMEQMLEARRNELRDFKLFP